MVSTIYTPRQREQIRAVFKTARKTIWDGYGDVHTGISICHNIQLSRASARARREARRIVMDRLGGHMTVFGYLRHEVRVPLRLLMPENLQEFRMRWLDELIREFSD